MIELGDDCEYTILIADLIATLMTKDKHDESFTLKMWVSNTELPLVFESHNHFDFLQEGLRVETESNILYIFYDLISLVEVLK